MVADVASDEMAVLVAWKRRSDRLVLIRLKAEAILYASRGVDVGVVAEMVDRSVRTVAGWLADWRRVRLGSVVTGHAGNQNAARLTGEQKASLREVLAAPPSRNGVPAQFWDVPALRDVVATGFDVEYTSASSYQVLMRFLGMSFKLPDAFDRRRDEAGIKARMGQITEQVAGLLREGYEVYTVDEVRVEYQAETRRMWLPRGARTTLTVDRKRVAKSFFGALSLTTKTVKVYPVEGPQNAEQVIVRMARLQRETTVDKIAVVLDNAGFHHAKDLTRLFEPGAALERITPIYLPPYAPDHNPTEHVWNAAKGHITNPQRDTSEQTFNAYITGRTFDYDFKHLPITRQSDLV